MSPDVLNCHGPRRGVALVTVLALLVLITALVLAFFTGVTGEVAASKSHAGGADARVLADTAVNLVISQIEAATDDGSLAWISQPGLIRTFEPGNPMPVAAYKLYSAESLVEDGTFDPMDNTDIPSDWASNPALFTDINSPVTTAGGTNYPILNPSAQSVVPSFALDPGLGVQMPLRWIYVLEDGSLATPSPSGADSVTLTVAPGGTEPGPDNPIIGRIAFWADDESTKVNVNTAAGYEQGATEFGTFWDVPRASSQEERGLAASQPATREFQRFPGHPATVNLSSVFPNLSVDEIYEIAPRVEAGGSEGGTRTVDVAQPVTLDSDRLYDSPEEVIFAAQPGGAGRENHDGIDPDALAAAGFFLTAHSRAPDTNLFNMPRVSLWPIPANTANRTAFDAYIARCATIGGLGYFFTRSNPDSSTADFTGRNVGVYNYLRELTGREIPGFDTPTNGFESKYTAHERDQILTLMYDYIRTVNLVDTQTGAVPFTAVDGPGRGQVIPSVITTPAGETRGFGRFETFTEAALIFRAALYGNNQPNRLVEPLFALEPFSAMHGYAGYIPRYRVRVIGLKDFRIRINHESGFETREFEVPLFSQTEPADGWINYMHSSDGFRGRRWGGAGSAVSTTMRDGNVPKQLVHANGFENYPWYGDPINVFPGFPDAGTRPPPNQRTTTGYTVSANTLQVFIETWDGSEIVQQFTLQFPEMSFANLSGGTSMQVRFNNMAQEGDTRTLGPNTDQFITNSDAAKSLVPSANPTDTTLPQADSRLIALRQQVPQSWFEPKQNPGNDPAQGWHYLTDYRIHTVPSTASRGAHNMRFANGRIMELNGGEDIRAGKLVGDADYQGTIRPDIPPSINGVGPSDPGGWAGDWDNGIGSSPDGPFANKADEGAVVPISNVRVPYFSDAFDNNGTVFFSPNRQVPSAVMFGSLPTGAIRNRPWQTLLFRPTYTAHEGSEAPHDHLLLDLFQMPVVEPYAISEPFSTAGRINLNHQIVPFTHIRRDQGLRAALDGMYVTAIPTSAANTYKTEDNADSFRIPLDVDATLEQIQTTRLDQNLPFVSASEICEMPLIPEGESVGSIAGFWETNGLTGDNTKEAPYARIYPLLTTRSNTFTVHVRVQSLKKVVSDPNQDVWNEAKDKVEGEYRGSFTIERYLDPNNASLVDASGATTTDELGVDTKLGPYLFRVLNARQFSR